MIKSNIPNNKEVEESVNQLMTIILGNTGELPLIDKKYIETLLTESIMTTYLKHTEVAFMYDLCSAFEEVFNPSNSTCPIVSKLFTILSGTYKGMEIPNYKNVCKELSQCDLSKY